ncbi:GNAT family N-acetyltransferase [Bacillus salacetis]|uniref:GNAT family N-acetyltransferase n=1 Tax=Bacillus salacetis TaxID=2315464 RepID=A0A3A1R3I2_9BACI|nr:GNAT family N-acetyltransferase [Bacillus salacetis]RIW37278.1 GNAT family N-acetyltransferase [Bacillus salacetis]
MKTTAEQIRIVEYHEGLAKGIAKMWNESRENWGGDSVVMTEQDVKEKEANSTNLHLFLAMAEDEVVGYCGLSQYREDTGALYIPLLNVHPDYQGLKIGKQLVLKALDRTIELKWPRLDLFTWAGNTKAVPLYKKCGFFWEERDDSTHLMNFIPLVMQIEWLRPFFEKHDWYTTSQREINIEPDGFKDNEHTYYEYKWQAGEEFVRVQIERTGRGIRLIETQDLLLAMEVPGFKLLENDQHPVIYKIINRTGNPFLVSLAGSAEPGVDHSFSHSVTVEKEWTGEFPVSVTVSEREPSPWKTHPVISAVIQIDGNQFPLKAGVFPKKAGKVFVRSTKRNWRAGQNGLVHLDIENQLDEECTFTLQLPENQILNWERTEVDCLLKGKEKTSIPVPVTLLKNGFLSEQVEVSVTRADHHPFRFKAKLTLSFPGFGSKFGGESEEKWYGYNGPFFVEIEKRNHIVKVGTIHSSGEALTFFSPKLGKPFSEEFSKKEASNVEFIDIVEAMVIKTSLESDAFPSLILNTYFKLFSDGYLEISHEIVNMGSEAPQDGFLLQPVYPELKSAVIPQKDGVMAGTEAVIPFIDYIKDKEISENWIFIKGNQGETTGLAWPPGATGRKDDWRFGIEYRFDQLKPLEKTCFGPIGVGINTSRNWKQWREFVEGEDAPEVKEIPMYDLQPKDGNFISAAGETVEYSFKSMLTPYVHGSVKLKSEGAVIERRVQKEDELSGIPLQIEHHSPGIKVIEGNFRNPGQTAAFSTIQLVKGGKEIEIEEEGGNWNIDNGILSFKASPGYYPGIYSLSVNGTETLHNQFPHAGPKAWWNPWGGGIRYFFQSVSPYSMMKEETSIEKVSRIDQNGHEWKGICLTTSFAEHETMKGTLLKQYALTLPEVPIVACYAEVHQNSGRTFNGELLDMEAFFKPGEDLSSSFAKLPSDGVFEKYYAGIEEFVLGDTDYVTVGSDDREDKITLIHSPSRKLSELYMNQEVFVVASTEKWSASCGETFTIKPTLLLFGEESPFNNINLLKGLSFR